MNRSIEIIAYLFLYSVFKNKYHSVHICYTCLRARSHAAVVISCVEETLPLAMYTLCESPDIEVTKKNEKTALQRLMLSKLDVFKKIRRIQVHLFQTFLKFNPKIETEAQILYIIHTWNCFLTQEKIKKNHPCYKCYTAIIRRAYYRRPYAQIRTNSTRLTCCVINKSCLYSNNVFSFHDKSLKVNVYLVTTF